MYAFNPCEFTCSVQSPPPYTKFAVTPSKRKERFTLGTLVTVVFVMFRVSAPWEILRNASFGHVFIFVSERPEEVCHDTISSNVYSFCWVKFYTRNVSCHTGFDSTTKVWCPMCDGPQHAIYTAIDKASMDSTRFSDRHGTCRTTMAERVASSPQPP